MSLTLVLCLLGVAAFAMAFAVAAPLAGRRLPPPVAVRLLVAGAVLVAGTTTYALASVVMVGMAQLPLVASWGDWSAASIRTGSGLPVLAIAVCAALLLAAGVNTVLVAVVRVRALVAVRRACRGPSSVVTVVDSPLVEAFAAPGRHRRIVVTTALLDALSSEQREAVIAHERSHLWHGHSWWLLAVDLAAAANPVLAPTASAVAHAIERWADEDAAAVVGDRRVVATAIATVARRRHRQPAAGLAATGGRVPQRVRALLDGPPRPNPLVLTLLLAIVAGAAVGALALERQQDSVFDNAEIPSVHAVTDVP